MKYAAAAALLLFGLPACSGPGSVSPKKALVYEMPETPTLIYVSEGTQNQAMDAGPMGAVNTQVSSEGTLAMTFAPVEGGLEVTVEFQKLTASLSNPMMGTQTASESDIDGNLVFTIDAFGHGTLVSTPEVAGSAAQLIRPGGLVYEFFPRLPGRAVDAGDTWTDTTSYELPAAEGLVTMESITDYTVVGDTVVDGVSLIHISFSSEIDSHAEVSAQGMDVIQDTSGQVTGIYLWDPARGVLVFAESEVNLDGSTEVPAAGIPPMASTTTGSGTVRLQGG